jgi:hypothetical protein
MSAKLTNADAPQWGLYAKTPNRKNMDARKSIKVKLPIRQHIKLHALKLFTEKNISETVEKALDHYFREMKDSDQEAVGKMEANLQNHTALDFEVGVDADE